MIILVLSSSPWSVGWKNKTQYIRKHPQTTQNRNSTQSPYKHIIPRWMFGTGKSMFIYISSCSLFFLFTRIWCLRGCCLLRGFRSVYEDVFLYEDCICFTTRFHASGRWEVKHPRGHLSSPQGSPKLSSLQIRLQTKKGPRGRRRILNNGKGKCASIQVF
jgi:hypothetical protein